MTGIIDNLRMFNRKERFFLIGMALGNPDFKLSEEFRRQIGEVLHLDIPENVFTAMDYHLDWLYASLFLASHGDTGQVYPNADRQIQATQEDIDLLIAYEDGNVCHIVMLEAKGVTGFTRRQLRSKVND